MGQPVVLHTTYIMYLILYEYIVCTGTLQRIKFHKLRFHFTLILSGFYNDQGGKLKNICIKSRHTIFYKQFVPCRKQHISSCEKDHLETAILVHGCNIHCDLHTVQR